MTTVPLPSFLPADALDEFEKFDGPLIYLAAPLGHQDPSVRQDRFESVNRYCGYLIRHRTLFLELVSKVVEIASRQPSSLSGYCLLGAHR